MEHRIIVPEQASAGVPQGAAVVRVGRQFRVHAGGEPGLPFRLRCALALREGTVVRELDGTEAGVFNPEDGAAVLSTRGRVHVEGWLGRRLEPRDLQAAEPRPLRRAPGELEL